MLNNHHWQRCQKDIYRLQYSRDVLGKPGGKPHGSLVFLPTGHVWRATFRTHLSYGCHRTYSQNSNSKQEGQLKIGWQFSRA